MLPRGSFYVCVCSFFFFFSYTASARDSNNEICEMRRNWATGRGRRRGPAEQAPPSRPSSHRLCKPKNWKISSCEKKESFIPPGRRESGDCACQWLRVNRQKQQHNIRPVESLEGEPNGMAEAHLEGCESVREPLAPQRAPEQRERKRESSAHSLSH